MQEITAGWLVRVQAEDFDPGAHIAAMTTAGSGAVVSFVGIARDLSEGRQVGSLLIEHYPGMTERSLADILRQARERFGLLDGRIVHRYGILRPADRIVLAAAASVHREAAFDACRFLMDYLKTRAPFWKREEGPGGGQWVLARDADEAALARWSGEPDRTA